MNNEITEVDFIRSLPPPLKDDGKMLVLAKVIAEELQNTIRMSKANVIYARINELPEKMLDILAYDLHVDWYDDRYTLEEKRRIIKESVKVHRYKGTKYAVETAVSGLYPDSLVSEWFEYGGEAYGFRVYINIGIGEVVTVRKQEDLAQKIECYKNLRSHLDAIIFAKRSELGKVYLKRQTKSGMHVTTHPYIPQKIDTRIGTKAIACPSIGTRITIHP